MPRKLVFIGPTLPAHERPDSDVEYFGPVRHGSLFSQSLDRGDVVLIVDGIYQNFAPLRHKEIMAHLAMGVRVYGSASYGALRAAELQGSGVVPLGKVARAYCEGTISDDAEVAVLHSPDDHHSRLTVPMVSVRFAVARLLDRRQLNASEAQDILNLVSKVHFSYRTIPAMRQVLECSAVAQRMDLLCQELRDTPDVKSEDAKEAIIYVSQLEGCHITDRPDIQWQTSFSKIAEFETRRVQTGYPLTHRQLAVFLQLMKADYPECHKNYVSAVVARSSTTEFTSAEDAFLKTGYSRETLDNAPFGGPTRATSSWAVAERILVRTFRLTPGTQARFTLPDGLPGPYASLVATLSGHLSQVEWTTGRAAEWKRVLMALYQCNSDEEFELCCMERGLLNEKNALRLASQFDISLASERVATQLLADCHV